MAQPPIVAPARGLNRLTRLAGQVLVIAAALAVLGYAIGYSIRFVSSRLQPPATATEALVLAAVKEKLVVCAKAAVFEPTSCPQTYYTYGGGEAVSWSLHGDPMDGAEVSWNPFSEMFDVYGIAVMVVRYTEYGSGAQVDIVAVGYHATLVWEGEKASIRSISGDGPYGSEIDKKADGKSRSALLEPDFQNALRLAFDRCISVREPELPPECPRSGYGSSYGIDDATNFRWSLVADPLLNATFGYDDRLGLVKISGDYVFGLDYREKHGGAVHKESSGPYEASLIVENGVPVVLQIRRRDS
jgi:hypothetical protein